MGTITGGWGFVIAGYALTAMVLVSYTISLVIRSRVRFSSPEGEGGAPAPGEGSRADRGEW